MHTMKQIEAIAQKALRCRECFESDKMEASTIDIAQPRYIGPKYWKAELRILVLMLNPGSGKNDAETNKVMRQRLYDYRARKLSLERLFGLQRADMKNWASGRFWKFYIEGLNLDVEVVAFANIAWCSTDGNKYPMSMLRRCYEQHTGELIEKLAPQVILFSGKYTLQLENCVRTSAPNAKFIPTMHYAHRKGHKATEVECTRVRHVLLGMTKPNPKN